MRATVRVVANDPDLLALGRAIRALRQAKGLTQEELGHRAALSTKYVSDVERGQRNFGVRALFALAHALGESPAALFAVVRTNNSDKAR